MTIEAAMLRHDKIELEVTGWYLEGDEQSVENFFGDLATRRDWRGQETGWVFNGIGRGISGGYARVDIARPRSPDRPLFGGYLTVRGGSSTGGRPRYALILRLSINPTRFLNYQSIVDVEGDALQQFELSPPQMRRSANRVINGCGQRTREVSLYDCDNYLYGNWDLTATPERWPGLVGQYLDQVLQCIRGELSRASEGIEVDFTESQLSYVLKGVECYIDMDMAEPMRPIEFVPRYQEALSSYGRSSRRNDFEVSGLGDVGALSRQFSIDIGLGKMITVYAKTNRRVRFEVRYNLSQLRRTQSARSQIQLVTFITERETRCAATDLNAFWSHLRLSGEVSDIRIPSYLFLGRLAELCGVHTSTILSSLINNNAVTLERGRSPFRRVVSRLLDEGILQRSGPSHHHSYLPTPQYRQAIQNLRQLDMRD